ncbi:hypothetical protein U1Q18_034641 [Sarracenia purpurea var. burkii]
MISSKKLLKMARKWQKLATISRKRISFPRTKGHFDEGHFVVYTADQRRFVIPLAYLNTELFRELLKMAEEEYGLPSHGADRRRFLVPLANFNNENFIELLKMAVED